MVPHVALSFLSILLGAMPATGDHRYKPHRRAHSTFLGAVNAAKLQKQLQHAIKDSLGNEFDKARMTVVKAELNPMWQTLVKDVNDGVDLRSLRYALQRYMHKKYHVSIIGLETGVNEHTRSAAIMSHAPELVANILHGNSTGAESFQIGDLAATIAMLEQLLVHSGRQMVETIFHNLELDPRKVWPRDVINQVMESYLLRWIMNDDPLSVTRLEDDPHLRDATLPEWPAMAQFVHGLVDAFEYAHATNPQASQRGSQWRPMRPYYSFEDANTMVGHLLFSFGSYWRDECDNAKELLLELDPQSTGRVKLSDFHGAALGGEWRFSESKEYLRKMGALDESSVHHGPRVIIPNYLHGPSNCIVSDTRYRVCCYNDCEGYMAEIEESVASPAATLDQLLTVVSNIASNMDSEESAITSSLKSQLSQIAQLHQGQIPLHGRLFAQWLHYVFPRDCPFPHKAGIVSKMTPMEFGDGYMANDAEMRLHVRQNLNLQNQSQHRSQNQDDWMTQWSQDEELLTGDFELKAPWESRVSITSRLVSIAMLGSFALVMLGKVGFRDKSYTERACTYFRSKEHLV